MDFAARTALETEILFYITAALVTFLAVLLSFKWVYRKTTAKRPQKVAEIANVCPVHSAAKGNVHSSSTSTEDMSQQVPATDGHEGDVEEDEEDLDDIQDLLIDHNDIKLVQHPTPMGDSTTCSSEISTDQEELVSGTEGAEGDGEEKAECVAGPQKTKKLVEEVSKMMSDEQKAEERRIQSEQLEAIFKLVQNQQDTFGIDTLQDIQDQFKLYA